MSENLQLGAGRYYIILLDVLSVFVAILWLIEQKSCEPALVVIALTRNSVIWLSTQKRKH